MPEAECKALCGIVALPPVYNRLSMHYSRVSMLQVHVLNAFAAAGGFVHLVRLMRIACGQASEQEAAAEAAAAAKKAEEEEAAAREASAKASGGGNASAWGGGSRGGVGGNPLLRGRGRGGRHAVGSAWGRGGGRGRGRGRGRGGASLVAGGAKRVTDIHKALEKQESEDAARGGLPPLHSAGGAAGGTRGLGGVQRRRAPAQKEDPEDMSAPLAGSIAAHSYEWVSAGRAGDEPEAAAVGSASSGHSFPRWVPSFEALSELCKAVGAPTRKIIIGDFGKAFGPVFLRLVAKRVQYPTACELQRWVSRRFAALSLLEDVSDVSMDIVSRYDFDADKVRAKATLCCGLSLLRWGIAGLQASSPDIKEGSSASGDAGDTDTHGWMAPREVVHEGLRLLNLCCRNVSRFAYRIDDPVFHDVTGSLSRATAPKSTGYGRSSAASYSVGSGLGVSTGYNPLHALGIGNGRRSGSGGNSGGSSKTTNGGKLALKRGMTAEGVKLFLDVNDVLLIALGGARPLEEREAEGDSDEWVPLPRRLEEETDPIMPEEERQRLRTEGHHDLAGMKPCLPSLEDGRVLGPPAFLLRESASLFEFSQQAQSCPAWILRRLWSLATRDERPVDGEQWVPSLLRLAASSVLMAMAKSMGDKALWAIFQQAEITSARGLHPDVSQFLMAASKQAGNEIRPFKRRPPFATNLSVAEWDAPEALRLGSPKARPRGTDEYPFAMPILWRACNPQAEANGVGLEARLAAEQGLLELLQVYSNRHRAGALLT